MCWDFGKKRWTREGFSHTERNEDLNFNGIQDSGEGVLGINLRPGFVATLVPAQKQSDGTIALQTGQASDRVISLTTDSEGFAYFALQYGKTYAPWAAMKIVANARVGGSESRYERTSEWLRLASEDVTDQQKTPISAISPYGTGGFACP